MPIGSWRPLRAGSQRRMSWWISARRMSTWVLILMSPPRRCQKRCFEHYRGGACGCALWCTTCCHCSGLTGGPPRCRPNTSDGCALWRVWQTIFAVSRQRWPMKSRSGLNSPALRVCMRSRRSGTFIWAPISQTAPRAGGGPRATRQCALRSIAMRPPF